MPTYPAIPDVTNKSVLNVHRALKEGYEISRGYYDSDDTHQSFTNVDEDLQDPTKHTVVNIGKGGRVRFAAESSTQPWRIKRETHTFGESFTIQKKRFADWDDVLWQYTGYLGGNSVTDGSEEFQTPTGAPNWGSFTWGNGATSWEYGYWHTPGTGGWGWAGEEIHMATCTDLTSTGVAWNSGAFFRPIGIATGYIHVYWVDGSVRFRNGYPTGGTIYIQGHFNQTT
ncbi:MAG: hypothetical protein GY841_16125 [FCB group bacterium]|nr:hypothetical protein [FCB group bacterium]